MDAPEPLEIIRQPDGALIIGLLSEQPGEVAEVLRWNDAEAVHEAHVVPLTDHRAAIIASISSAEDADDLAAMAAARAEGPPTPYEDFRRELIAAQTPSDEELAACPSQPPQAWYDEDWSR